MHQVVDLQHNQARTSMGTTFGTGTTNTKTVLPEGATILHISENASGEITEDAVKEASPLDTIVDKMLFHFLAAACTVEVLDMVRNVPGGVGSEAWRRFCRRHGMKTCGGVWNPPKVKELADAAELVTYMGRRSTTVSRLTKSSVEVFWKSCLRQ